MQNQENQSVQNRLIQFIMFKNMSINRFEKELGVSNGYVKNMRKSIQPDKVKSIALKFPELNTGWLMTGEGEMLRNEAGEKVESSADRTDKLIESNLELIRQSAELIWQQGELIKQQGDLIGLLKKLSN